MRSLPDIQMFWHGPVLSRLDDAARAGFRIMARIAPDSLFERLCARYLVRGAPSDGVT